MSCTAAMATAPISQVTTTSIDFDANRYKTILWLAMPTVFAMLSQSFVNEIDVFFFAHLPHPDSSNGQAALFPSLIIVWLFGGSLSALSVGTQALAARRYAEGDHAGAGAVLTNATFFCVVMGAVLSVVGYLAVPSILGFMLKNPGVLATATAYARWRLLGVIGMATTMAVKSFFDGIGKTYVHLVAALIMNVFNVLFCWMFIFGRLGAPAMGAPGAGLGAFLATWIGLLIMLWFARQVRQDFSLFRRAHLSAKLNWDILKLSIPAALANIIMMGGFALFSKVVGQLDESAINAAGGIAEAVNGAATTDIVAILKLTFTACIAFGTATATLVGQSLGARRPDDASAFGWASVKLGLVLFGFIGLCEGLIFTPQILHFLSHSPAVREAALTPMRMMGVMTPIIAVAMILSEALFGAGNPKFVAVAQFLLVFFCLLPFAYVLGIVLNLGLTGIWAAACIYAGLAAVVMTLKFRAGAWKKIRL
ncbi:MATE family efflux transporter [Pendulispora rubella]|uniref:Multidrug-efflux transporter n=1 Tax=Pendulispora rubella TaxID=2741070 RepID=A0ABZ2KY10_9BACT